jgi:hypothetical protein
VTELPLDPEALVPACALAFVPDCPVDAFPDAPMPAPLEEVPVELPVEFGVAAVAFGLDELPGALLLFCVPDELCAPTEPDCGLLVVVPVVVLV